MEMYRSLLANRKNETISYKISLYYAILYKRIFMRSFCYHLQKQEKTLVNINNVIVEWKEKEYSLSATSNDSYDSLSSSK